MQDKKCSQSSTTDDKDCLCESVVTDQFKRMMTNAFEKTKAILKRRYDDLTSWDAQHQKEFSKIFGVDGGTTITTKYYSAGQHLTDEPRDAPSLIIMPAHDFMKQGVKRLIDICDLIDVGMRTCDIETGFYLYGNFLNETSLSVRASARVAKGQTLNKTPDKYKDTLRIEILQNFQKRKLTGVGSQVSTLCHELSHLIIYQDKGALYGGMGTDDFPKGDFSESTHFLSYAAALLKAHSPLVFENAYNVEKYFELEI